MCDEQAEGIGDLVPDEAVLYRACSKSSFLTPSRDAVAPDAFHKAGKNHQEGLSLALTVQDAIRELNKNHGVIKITVASIRSTNPELEVRYDTTIPNHVLIRNMPCMDRELNERTQAEALARTLANQAEIESATSVTKTLR